MELFAVMTKCSVVVSVDAGTRDEEGMLDSGGINIMRTVQVTVDADEYNSLRTELSRSSVSP